MCRINPSTRRASPGLVDKQRRSHRQGCDVAIGLDFELEQFKIKFRNLCFLHQLHLIVKRQLEKLGKKYFSTLAKVIHIWRAGQNHKKLKEICEAMTLSTNPGLAATAFRRLPPTPLRGRWLSVTGAEAAILVLGKLLYHMLVELSSQSNRRSREPSQMQRQGRQGLCL